MRTAPLVLLAAILPLSSIALAQDVQPENPVIGSDTARVTVLDMEALVSGVSGAQMRKLFSNPDQVKRVAEKLYVNELLAREARALGLAEQPLQQAVLAQKANEYLAGQRLRALDAEPVPDMGQAAYERYLANPEDYSTPTRVRAAHILVRFLGRTGETRSKDEAREMIADLRRRALAGESFEDLAQAHSEDPSARRNNGDLGFFGRGQMVKAFEDAAFALREPGQISDVVETSFGFHVLKLIEREDGELKPFDEVKADIVAQLEGAFRSQRRSAHVDSLQNGSGAVLYEDIFDGYVAQKRTLMGFENPLPPAAEEEPAAR